MHRTAALVITGLLFLTACSNSADPEDVADLSSTFTESTKPLGAPIDEDRADCLARTYLESDLSDEAKEAIKDGQPPAPKTEDDVQVLRRLADEIARDCLASGDPQPQHRRKGG